jgi:UDPglucose 6-dehydrogenase
MRVTIFGSGYVGLVTGACLAEAGNHVMCVDVDAEKTARLNEGEIPIHEPGLDVIVKRNREAGRLEFTTDAAKGVEHGLFQLIAVGTPPDEDGSADLRHVLAVAQAIGTHMARYAIVVTKSTVPVGTADRVRGEIQTTLQARGATLEFDVVSNPEFLKEGAAIQDFMKPDRIIIGTDNPRTVELMRMLYEPFTRNHERFIVMDVRSSELTKYAANAMLATKISFMNELANMAERVGADIEKVRLGIGSDPRIVLPQGRAGAHPLLARCRPSARDPAGGRGGEPSPEGGAGAQDAPSLRRPAPGSHSRPLGARVQAQHR